MWSLVFRFVRVDRDCEIIGTRRRLVLKRQNRRGYVGHVHPVLHTHCGVLWRPVQRWPPSVVTSTRCEGLLRRSRWGRTASDWMVSSSHWWPLVPLLCVFPFCSSLFAGIVVLLVTIAEVVESLYSKGVKVKEDVTTHDRFRGEIPRL